MKTRNFFKPARPFELDYKMLSDSLKADIDAFLARGGVIQQLGPEERGQPLISPRRGLNNAQIRAALAKRAKQEKAADEEE